MDVKRYTPCNIGRTINRPILLGKVGEQNALRIEFGCEEWLTDYPNATIDLYVKRPDNDGYHAAMGEDGYNRIWIIDERAVLTAGNGTIELILKDAESGTKIKAATGYTTVASSPSAGDEPSDLGFIAYNRQQNLTEAQKRIARTNIGAGTGSGDGTGGGTDGFSPTIEVVSITGGHRLIITDVYGEKTVDVMDGKAGAPGAAGAAGRGIVSVVRTSGNGSAGSTDTYTITYTDNTTSKITVYNGKDGADGTNGVSPTIAVEAISGGHRVTITDVNGTKSFDILDGKDGVGGEGGSGADGEDGGYYIPSIDAKGNLSWSASKAGMPAAAGANIKGTDGEDGEDGVSPTVVITPITGGNRITITDANGAKSFDIMNGKDGQDGADGSTAEVIDDAASSTEKTYSSSKIDELLAEQKEANAQQDQRLTTLEQAGGIATVEPAQDDVPIVFFGGDLPQTKTDTVMPFKYVSKTKTVCGYVETKAQGNSSMSYPKKNQTVKMYADEALEDSEKVDFKGWGAQKKHVYKANWIDLTHSRNIVSARLWGDVVKSRANYLDLPELLRTSPNQGAVDGFPALVYANGVYQGRYTINIPKDAWMANMDDNLDEHCILCGENYVSGCFRAAANINGNDWTDEIHDTVPAAIKTRWNEIISFVMNATDEDFKANLGNYFYLDSLIDYYLFGVVSCGLDAFGKNQLYQTYDGQKWIATMYDMDSTWGLWWNGGSFVATTYARTEFQDFKDGQGNLLYIRLEKLFYEQIQERWEELRDGALSYSNIMMHFERFIGIVPPHIVKEDYASTTGGGKFTGIPSQNTNHIQQIRAYVAARLPYVDGWFASLTPEEEIPCTGITLDKTTLTFDGKGTQTLTATVTPSDTTDAVVWSSGDSSIASVSGGVVTAKANGNVTITATCGAYSATCAVSVSGIEAGGDSEAVPDEYEVVEYIQSSGTQYIDTGISGGTNATYEIKLNTLGTTANNWEQYFSGQRSATIPKLYNSHGGPTIGVAAAIGGDEGVKLYGQENAVHVVEYKADGAHVYVDGVAVSLYNVENDPSGNGWGDETWYIFSSHGEPNLKASMRLYYLEMWTGDELVRQFVPVKRVSDNVYGLYDLVGAVFYENSGTGVFTGPIGGEVEPSDTLIVDTPYAGLYKENGLDTSISQWVTSEIIAFPTGFEYDTVNIDAGSGQKLITVFDADKKFVKEISALPFLIQNVQHFAVSKQKGNTANLTVTFTETYPGATKITTPYKGLYKQNGLDSSVANWVTSEITAIPDGVESAKIRFCDGAAKNRLITTFDAEKKFIKEHSGNLTELTLDSAVKYYAISLYGGVAALGDKSAEYVYVTGQDAEV